MIYRRLDENKDFTFGHHKANFVSDIEAFVQAVTTKFNLFKGEWWRNFDEGVPFYEEIAGTFIGDDEEINLVTQIYLQTIAKVDGYKDVLGYEEIFDKEKRIYKLKVKVDTDFGATTLEV